MKPASSKTGKPRPPAKKRVKQDRATKAASQIKGLLAEQAESRAAATRSVHKMEQAQEQQHLLELENKQLGEIQADLELGRRRYADLYDRAPVGYLTLDRRGCIREMNQAAGELLGWSSAHLLGMPLLPHIAAADRKVFLKHLWDSRHSTAQVITTLRLVAKEGVERHVQFATSHSHKSGGRPEWCRTAMLDITAQHHAEEALRESEAKFRLLAENMGEVFWFMDLDPLRVTYVSPAFEKIYGASIAAIYENPMAWLNAIHPEDLAGVHTAFERWIKGEAEAFQVEYRVINRHGDIHWVTDSGIVLGRKNGVPHHVSGIARDITERKQAETERQRSETKFRSLLEAAPDAMIIVDGRGIIQLVNAQAMRLFGYEREEMVDQVAEMLVAEPLRKCHARQRDNIITAPRGDPLRRGMEFLGRRKDGSEFPTEITLSPLRTEDGVLVINAIRDLTERKRAEAKFRSLLEAAPDAMIIVDDRGIVQLVNAQTLKLFGYTREELVGQPMEILVPERFRNQHPGLRAEYAAAPQPRSMGTKKDMFALRKDGSEFPMEISLSPLHTKEGLLVISAVRDITERKQAERELLEAQRFAQSTLEAIPASLAVLDETGTVISTNRAWQNFAEANSASPYLVTSGVNYLAACDATRGDGAPEAGRFAEGIRQVMHGDRTQFSMEYPCRGPGLQRWFVGYVTAFSGDGPPRVVIAHVDISERKRAEQVIMRLNAELETRVEERTVELRRTNEELRLEIARRRRLEAEILEISESEQQRIGQDLHDDLGQQLAGISCLSRVLENNLIAQKSSEAEHAAKITRLLKNALTLTRSLARGLHPVALQSGGLMTALDELTQRISDMFRVTCRCKCPPVPDMDNTVATHLYRIAQEAVTNAVKHGNAGEIEIELSFNAHHTVLSVKDNGAGLPAPDPKRQGMGLRIMTYRADMIGGALGIQNDQTNGGTVVTCTIPTRDKEPPTEPPYGQKPSKAAGKAAGNKSLRRR